MILLCFLFSVFVIMCAYKDPILLFTAAPFIFFWATVIWLNLRDNIKNNV